MIRGGIKIHWFKLLAAMMGFLLVTAFSVHAQSEDEAPPPAAVEEEPAETADKPEEKPAETADKPAGDGQQPAAADQKPAGDGQQPATADQKPAGDAQPVPPHLRSQNWPYCNSIKAGCWIVNSGKFKAACWGN